MSGLFITLEGTEGAGKSSVVPVIEKFFNDELHKKTICLREPGGTFIAEKIRQILKEPCKEEKLCDKSELLLMYAARAQLVESVIKPKITEGYVVICDRHDLSTYAYQGGGRGLPISWIQKVREVALGDFKPNMTLLLDIDPIEGMKRARQRGELDRFEQEKMDFFNRVRDTYLECAKKDSSIKVIDALKPIDVVQANVLLEIKEYLKNATK